MNGVYKYEVDGKVIYIGKTDSNFAMRIACHGRELDFAPYLKDAKIFVHETKDAYEADFLETLLINQYKPTLNKAKKNVTNVEVSATLEWVPWEKYSGKPHRRTSAGVPKVSHTFYLTDEVIKTVRTKAKEAGMSTSQFVDNFLTEIFKSFN